MLKKLELILLILITAGLMVLNKNIGKMAVSDDVKIQNEIIVLDAGHGGNDPGKVGVSGVLEKDINLQIAQKVKRILENKKYAVYMTREEDQMLGSELTSNRKREDMKERISIINEIKPDLVVSIHQNSFTDSSVSGAQVFYHSNSEEGERMALLMQEALTEIDENNHRKAKGNDSYYLLKQTEVPVLIVECGFLSNREEEGKLVQEEYQEKISNAIVRGIESCFKK